MDPITHAVIGMSISKITGNGMDFSNAATLGLVIGSVFPDIDILMQNWGDYAYLKNHRGATHAIIGMLVSSAVISVILRLVLNSGNIAAIFLWTLAGTLSHCFFDIFNSYGAEILWPFIKRRYTFSTLISYDPVFTGLLTGFIFARGKLGLVFLGCFISYMVYRAANRVLIRKELKKKYGDEYEKISVFPSMKGLFKWHFVMEGNRYNVIGEKNVLKRTITIINRLEKLDSDVLAKAVCSPIGILFSEFTPLFHVECEKKGKYTRYVFADMRYYIKDDFLHHAILELDEKNSIVTASFNPYSMNRCSYIPIRKLIPYENQVV